MTYKQRLDSLAANLKNNPSSDDIAAFMATSFMMQWEGPDAEYNVNEVYDTTVKLRAQSAFKKMVKDPVAVELAKRGDHLGLIQLMDVKENEARQNREAYSRSQEQVKEDAAFLKDAAEGLKNGSAVGRPAELEKKNPRYIEMMRQVEAARMKTEAGVQLTAAENKAMVTAVKKYIQNGSKVAGGAKQVPHFKEAMCVLKQHMPRWEFNDYIDQINEAHPKRKISADSFTQDRLNAKTFTAAELKHEAKKQLVRNFSEDGCATIMAIRNLSNGNRNALIKPEELEAEKSRLMQSGSAFRRALSNENDRQMFKEMAASGQMTKLGTELQKSSRNHALGSMQWQMNRSIRMLTEGPVNQYYASKYLAEAFAANQLAAELGPDTVLKHRYTDKVEEIEKDPAFKKLAQRYSSDPSYRQRINKDLQLDKTGSILALEYHKLKGPQRQAQAQPEAAQNRAEPQAGPV